MNKTKNKRFAVAAIGMMLVLALFLGLAPQGGLVPKAHAEDEALEVILNVGTYDKNGKLANEMNGGSATVDKDKVKRGETVTVTVNANPGFELNSISYGDGVTGGFEIGLMTTVTVPADFDSEKLVIDVSFEEMHEHVLEKVEAREPTCAAQGCIEHWICGLCGDYYRDAAGSERIFKSWEVWLKALPHQMEKHEGVVPTCSAPGVEEYWHCTSCNGLFKDEAAAAPILAPVELPADPDAHDWDEGTESEAPTCGEEGKKILTCKHNSAHTKEEAIPATGEHELAYRPSIPPTCVMSGMQEHWQCTKCLKVYSDKDGNNEIGKPHAIAYDPNAHDWGEWTPVTKATVDEEGREERSCKHDAAHKESRGIPKLPLAIIKDEEASSAEPKHTSGSGKSLVIKTNAAADTLESVSVDGKAVKLGVDCEITSGSTIATFKPAYLDTLSAGTHEVVFKYKDGRTISTKLTVAAAPTPSKKPAASNTTTPKTGDSSSLALFGLLASVSALGLTTGLVTLKKKSGVKR